MKKILLSCVTCLLALGLVTACNNEDEDVSGGGGDSTTQDTGTGGGTGGDTGTSSGGTEGGGAEEVTTLYNYTLSFTLTGEEIPDYATLYITGDFNEWGFEALEVGEGVYTYTFDTITVDWHNFKLVMWYSDEEVDWDSGNYVEVVYIPWVDEEGVTQLGNAYFEVTASQGDGYTLELTYEVSATLEEKIVSVTGVSISEGSPVVVAPEGTVQLHAVVTPSNATDPSVTWAVKEESDTEPTDPVVSVDQTGLVTAGANMGTATVEVTTTDGGYTAETVVYVISAESIIEDFTLTLSLGDEVTIPEYAELYLSYNGAYTLLEFNEERTATVSLGSVVIGNTISYSVYIVYSEEYRAMEGCPDVTESNIALSDTHTVAEGEAGISGVINSIPDLADPETSYQEVKIQINIYKDDALATPTVVPDYLAVYIQWTLDNWTSSSTPTLGGSGHLVEDDDGNPYTYAFKDSEALGPGHVDFTLYYEHASSDTFEWGDYTTKVENLSFDVPYFYDGETIIIDICDWGFAEAIEDLGGDTNFYIVVVDTGSAETSSFPEYPGFRTDSGVFLTQTDTDYCAGTAATTGQTSKACVYSSSYATKPAGSSEWFSLCANGWNDEIKFGTVTEIPEVDDGTYAVLVGYADLSKLGGTVSQDVSSWNWASSSITSITDFIATL